MFACIYFAGGLAVVYYEGVLLGVLGRLWGAVLLISFCVVFHICCNDKTYIVFVPACLVACLIVAFACVYFAVAGGSWQRFMIKVCVFFVLFRRLSGGVIVRLGYFVCLFVLIVFNG